jgi:hypothetical protein
MSTRLTWQPVADLPLFTCEYSFGPGLAKALAVPCNGGYAIVSPPCDAPDGVLAEIEKRGKVKAIVASNAFHNKGVAAWKARFPDAALFAPSQSIARVEKKGGVTGVKPLSAMGDLLGSDVEMLDMPHYKTGEVLVRVKSGSKVAWYVTDVIMNMAKIPPSFPFKQIFSWTKSGPGLRPNGFAAMMMVKDKKALYGWLREELEKAPPTVLVACHGDDVTSGAADRLRAVLPS